LRNISIFFPSANISALKPFFHISFPKRILSTFLFFISYFLLFNDYTVRDGRMNGWEKYVDWRRSLARLRRFLHRWNKTNFLQKN
jgi:hypothetical protein